MTSRILLKNENQIVLNEGYGYRIRATAKIMGAFVVVTIDWEHPNYGYFADAMLWYKSMNMRNWDVIPIVNWSYQYLKKESETKIALLKKFLKNYPEFKQFFNLEVSIWDNISFFCDEDG